MSQFIVESENILYEQDLINLRLLYSPIIGSTSFALYSYLLDACRSNSYKTDYKPTKVLRQFLQVNELDFISARKTLEAVGLIRTYTREDDSIFLFSLIKPLPVQKFLDNKILWNKLVSCIGELEAERVIFNSKTNIFEKSDFIEVTTRYHDIFKIETQKIASTLEIEVPKYTNKDEALEKASPVMFSRFISNDKPSPSLMRVLKDFKEKGFSDFSINLIINYSYEINGKLIAKYIETIGEDFLKSEVYSSDDIKIELERALMQRRRNDGKDNVANNISEDMGGEMSLDELFSDVFS